MGRFDDLTMLTPAVIRCEIEHLLGVYALLQLVSSTQFNVCLGERRAIVQYRREDLALSLDDFSRKYLQPAAKSIIRSLTP